MFLQLSIFHCFHCRAVWWSFQCTVTRTQWKNCPSSASTTTTRCTKVMETKTSTYQEGFSPPGGIEAGGTDGWKDVPACGKQESWTCSPIWTNALQCVFMNNQTEMCCRREVFTLQELIWRKEDRPNSEVLFWPHWTYLLFFTHTLKRQRDTNSLVWLQTGRASEGLYHDVGKREKVLCE